jgi:GNAT superfamily N-acetyltransferase
MDAIAIRPMQAGEETPVCELIARVFQAFVAPDLTPEGVQEFLKYVQPESLLERSQVNHFVLVGLAQDRIVGVIEVRGYQHVSLLFVDQAYQGRGIARDLWRRALDICRREKPGLAEVSVNSSPYAVPIYEKLGFRSQGPEQNVHGIRFVPMAFDLLSSRGS